MRPRPLAAAVGKAADGTAARCRGTAPRRAAMIAAEACAYTGVLPQQIQLRGSLLSRWQRGKRKVLEREQIIPW